MLTPAMFAFIVAAFCSWDDHSVPSETRLACTEFMNNCSFYGYSDGSFTTNKLVDSCKERWADERSRRHK